MEKLKIVINGNEHTASKAKEFFSKLGYHISSQNRNNAYGWSLGDGVGDYYWNKKSFDEDVAREITIQELRDMVVLKRNDDKTEAFNTKEMVNHPEHYNKHPSGIECIDIARHHDFAIGSAIKYLWRAGLKESDNEIQDLKKAVFYIQDKIKQLESKVVDDRTIDWIDEGNK